MAATLTHFEIYGEEPEKLAEFYRTLLGWEVERPPGADYWRIRTDPASGAGLNGGLAFPPMPGLRNWMHYVSVDSLDDTIAEVHRAGGEILRPKTAVPNTAWYALVKDPGGNIFAIWQADPLASPPPEPE